MIWRPVLAIAFLLLSIPSPLIAGDNPNIELFIEWDGADTNYIEPTGGSVQYATIYAENFGLIGGLTGVALRVVTGGSNLLFLNFSAANGGLVIGDIEGDGADVGWSMCQTPDETGRVEIGQLMYFYSAGADTARILPHVVDGDDAVDCNSDTDSWCVRYQPSGHASVWEPPPSGDCDPPGRVWNVPVDALTIEAGIDSAASGDTVSIAAGTYHEHDIILKAYVVVRGATGDPADVIVDADSLGRVFYANSVNRQTVLENLTIQEGYVTGSGPDEQGGGILCESFGNPTIHNCIFRYNHADGEGGGLKSFYGEPLILNCTFTDNYAGSSGGGMNLQNDSASVIDCVISNNRANLGGGGVYHSGAGGAYFEGCTICSNSVIGGILQYGGGARFGLNSRARVADCSFYANEAQYGGGLYYGSTGTGAFYLTGCTIAGNRATSSGGGLYIVDCTFWPEFCTIANNDAPDGAGVRLYNSSTTFQKSIIAFNRTGASITHGGTGTPELYCSDIYGNEGGNWIGAIAAYDSIHGNFHADPLFCTTTWNPDSAYTLQGASPCAGDTCGQIGSMQVGCGYRVTWTPAVSTEWNNPGNWEPVRVPGVDDEAFIAADDMWEVHYSGKSTIWKLTVEASVMKPNLYIESDTLTLITGGSVESWIQVDEHAALEVQAGGVFTVGDSATFTLRGGHLLGEGSFVNGGWFRKTSPLKTRTQSVVMLDFENRLDDPGDGAIIVWDSTLSFEGAFTNECTVSVKGGSEVEFLSDGESRAESTITNSGTIIVEDGGVLTIDGEGTEFLNLDDGKVLLKGTGSLAGSGRFINGGNVTKYDPAKSRAISSIAIRFDNRLDDPGDGSLTVVDGVLSVEDEFTNAGSTFVRSSSQVLLDPGDGASPPNAMTNSGVVIIESSADLTIQDSATVCTNLLGGEVILEGGNIGGDGLFDNYGTVIKTDPAKSRAMSSIACTINNRHDDPGDGAITVGEGMLSIEGVFVNSGSLFVSAISQVLLDPGDGAFRANDMINNGIVVVESGGDFGLNGTVTNSIGSDWVIGGTVLVDSFGDVTHYGAMEIESGGTLENEGDFAHKENAVLSGNGTFDNTEGNYSCGGVIRPGASVGTFSFLGDFMQTYTSEIQVEIGGTDPGTGYDLFAISGSATLAGAMHVDIVEPFEPIEGDSFAVVTIGGAKVASRGDIDCFSGLEIPGGLYLEPVEEPDVFAFRAVDSTVSNNAPIAADDLDSTFLGESTTLYVVENDTDPDADPVTIVSVSLGMTYGEATVDSKDTTLTYTPPSGWSGLDSLVYLITDCNGGVDSALAVVFVPRAPRIWSVPNDVPTIQAGIDSSIARDTVELEDNTYTGDGNRDLDCNGKAIVVRSESGDPAACVIDCEGAALDPHRGFYFHSGEDTTSVVSGVTITGGYRPGIGGGIYCYASSPKIINCVICENTTDPTGGSGGGVYCSYGSSLILSCCVIANNSAEFGGGIRSWDQCAPEIVHCTFAGNTGDFGGAMLFSENSSATINHTIVAFSGDGEGVRCSGLSSVTLTCSDVYGNAGGDYINCISGMNGVDGNISIDPWFCEPDSGNYALDINSPCLDAPGCSQIGALGSACDVITLVPEMGEADVPARYVLSQNIPNPFNPVTKLRFSLPNSGHVRLVVYDVAGREVNVLVDRGLQAGEFEAVWNGRNRAGRPVCSGVYFARMTVGEFAAVRKMILLK